MTYLEKVDSYLDSLRVGKSPLVDSWFLMSGPVPIMSIVVAYLVFVRIGPIFMKDRPPLKMHKLMTYYNAIQVLFSLLICYKAFTLNLFVDGIMYAGCRYPGTSQDFRLLDLGWYYFFAKYTELLDTVFFILRKKDKQVTFLHVYHHTTMAIYAWSYLKFAAGGQGAVMALLNSAVHVVMYTYYFLSGLGPAFQKYLWWKKYVTTMQLVQFVMMLSYCMFTHYSSRCQFTPGFTYFISSNVTVFLCLFLNFYVKSYKKKKAPEDEDKTFQTKNGIKNFASNKNGIKNIPNGINKNEKRENGVHDETNNTNQKAIAYKVDSPIGDYTKDGNMYLTKRTANIIGSEFDVAIKK